MASGVCGPRMHPTKGRPLIQHKLASQTSCQASLLPRVVSCPPCSGQLGLLWLGSGAFFRTVVGLNFVPPSWVSLPRTHPFIGGNSQDGPYTLVLNPPPGFVLPNTLCALLAFRGWAFVLLCSTFAFVLPIQLLGLLGSHTRVGLWLLLRALTAWTCFCFLWLLISLFLGRSGLGLRVPACLLLVWANGVHKPSLL